MTNALPKEKMEKTYKALFVPVILHQKIKLEATKNKQTIIAYLEGKIK